MPDTPRKSKLAHATDIEVGRRLRLQRKSLGLSQNDIGSALGITFQQVQKYEKGSNRIGGSRLLQIAKLLNVDVSYFFDTSIPSTQRTDAPDDVIVFIASPEGLALNRSFLKISDAKTRKKIVSLVKAIADSSF